MKTYKCSTCSKPCRWSDEDVDYVCDDCSQRYEIFEERGDGECMKCGELGEVIATEDGYVLDCELCDRSRPLDWFEREAALEAIAKAKYLLINKKS